MKKYDLGSVILLATTAVACGAPALPPPELVSAREAYTVAANGPASQLVPARLDEAKQALIQAEEAWEDDPKVKEGETLTLAYIAERKSRSAAALGGAAKAEKERKKYDDEYIELERKRASMTKEELGKVKSNLQEKEAELERERAARAAAESKLSAALSSLKEMASVKEEARGMVITLNGAVLFTTGKSELLPLAKQKLDEVAKALGDQGFKKIVIEGHTDSRGSIKDNERLSLERATAVKTHLVSQGLDAAKIEAVGLASTRPIGTNDTAEGRANNRRVELIVTH